ncbi:hypothetical protein DL96DRAFT_1533560 [Flagelloscypha sp. PMI_526]|nr:hypothetical protein DL96DRAFT_1533560 [Flagelloscypha sp. PMI_526]
MAPQLLDISRANGGFHSANVSQISLNTVHNTDARAPLISPTTPNYGAAPLSSEPKPQSSRRLLLTAGLKMATIFLVSCLLLGGILWVALPTLEEEDRDKLRVPRSFDQLKDLNILLKKYRDIFPYRIVICFVVTYLFLQAFSLPGSMYLSILGGAVWGVPIALPLVCVCVATGASLCYYISAALGPALLTLPRFKNKLDEWATKITKNKDNMVSFLIVLRIAPLPPHWVVNVVCPHVGVDIFRFWISTALGILGVSVIHTTIGGGLDDMTSPADFKLFSWKNILGLAAIVVGVLIPVGLRWYFSPKVSETGGDVEDGGIGPIHLSEDSGSSSMQRPRWMNGQNPHMLTDDEGAYSSDSDDDIVLEGGPGMRRSEDSL